MIPTPMVDLALTCARPASPRRSRWGEWLHHRHAETGQLARAGIALGLAGVVAAVDGLSSEELSLGVFHLLPIGYAAWFLGGRPALGVAAVCALLWFVVDAHLHPAYSHPLIPVWNAMLRLGAFAAGVAVMSVIKRAEEAARRRTADELFRRQRLEREMLELSAREQCRLAEDLHDGLGQYLSALAFQTRMLSEDLRREESPHLGRAERIEELVRTTNRLTRRIDHALRVPTGGDGGLQAAIRTLADEFQQLTGVRFELSMPATPWICSQFQTVMLVRIVQEAFSNAVKHGNPSRVAANLTFADDTVCLCIVDDGRPMAGRVASPGAGLRNMRLRAELIGAQLEAGPRPGGGFQVECTVAATEWAGEERRLVTR